MVALVRTLYTLSQYKVNWEIHMTIKNIRSRVLSLRNHEFTPFFWKALQEPCISFSKTSDESSPCL